MQPSHCARIDIGVAVIHLCRCPSCFVCPCAFHLPLPSALRQQRQTATGRWPSLPIPWPAFEIHQHAVHCDACRILVTPPPWTEVHCCDCYSSPPPLFLLCLPMCFSPAPPTSFEAAEANCNRALASPQLTPQDRVKALLRRGTARPALDILQQTPHIVSLLQALHCARLDVVVTASYVLRCPSCSLCPCSHLPLPSVLRQQRQAATGRSPRPSWPPRTASRRCCAAAHCPTTTADTSARLTL
jgi:hypothetical protein